MLCNYYAATVIGYNMDLTN